MAVSEADLNEVAWDVNAYSFFHVDMNLDEIDFNLDSPFDFNNNSRRPQLQFTGENTGQIAPEKDLCF
jgi:hypothetical protein